ncbi:AIG2-like protein [Lasiodiplodia theobromae]|nr:AIG2-like protein [Lasiodiplodia theobromae]
MDLLTDELERMATNIATYDGPEDVSEISLDSISSRPTPAQHAEAPLSKPSSERTATSRVRKTHCTYLMRLGGPLSTPSQIQTIARLATPPAIIEGSADDGTAAAFVRLPHTAVTHLSAWLTTAGIPAHQRPAFIRLSEAEKDLSPDSLCPTLGIDTTLPQHRSNGSTAVLHPFQDEFSVWYFFYGTLAEPERLVSLLGLEERPVLRRAAVRGGAVRTWGGKYKALVDGAERIDGWAYEVVSKEQEDALRAYETEKYEVVRCGIEMEGGEEVMGCTFRFADPFLLD